MTSTALATLIAFETLLVMTLFRKVRDQADRLTRLEGILLPDGFEEPPSLEELAGRPTPEFDLLTSDGRRVTHTDVIGKFGLLAFFSSSCPTCHADAAVLVEAVGEGRLPPTVAVVNPAGTGHSVLVRQLADAGLVVIDEAGNLTRMFGVMAVPLFVTVDADGVVTAAAPTLDDLGVAATT